MQNKVLNSFHQVGMWSSSYSFYYESAWLYLYDYEEIIKKLKTEEVRIARENKELSEEDLRGFTYHMTRDLHLNAYRYARSAHLFICMAIEGFINYYGTLRLGEEHYKRLLERVGITEKIAILYLLCFEIKLDAKSEIIQKIRAIFDQRNALVHPKTKEINYDNLKRFTYKHPEKLELEEAFKSLELFVSDFCLRDNEISRDFCFSKPNKSI